MQWSEICTAVLLASPTCTSAALQVEADRQWQSNLLPHTTLNELLMRLHRYGIPQLELDLEIG